MRRALLIGLSLAAATALPGAVAAQARTHAATDPAPAPSTRVLLHAFSCQRALDPAARAVDVTAVMKPISGTVRLAVEFNLLQRPSGAPSYAPVSGAGLGVFSSPADSTLGQRPGDVWIVHHPVADLSAPAAYRYQVVFHWIGSGGKVLASVTKQSKVCFQPELRPDLVVESVTVAADATHPKVSDDYTVTLANTGATAATNFALQLTSAGVVKTKTVDRLGPRETKTFTFVGPTCNSSPAPVVVADPSGAIDVSSRTGASYTVSCPAPLS